MEDTESSAPPSEVVRLLAGALGVSVDQRGNADPFALLEEAMTMLGIRVKLPTGAKHVDVGKWNRILQPGDHVLVRTRGSNAVFHHGIFVGEQAGEQADDYVVDMYGESKSAARLRIRPMSEFLNAQERHPELAVMRYEGDTPDARACTVALAMAAQRELEDCTGLYNFLGRNCQHFAAWCRTLRWDSLVASRAARAVGALPVLRPQAGGGKFGVHAGHGASRA